MADRLSVEQRSRLMARIRSKDTQPELVVRRLLHARGYRYVLHDRRLPGTPDLVFPARCKVIFVHGCFWHGHRCGRGFRPIANAAYWAAKIDANKARDRRQRRALRRLGWEVLEVFECLTVPARLVALEDKLQHFLGRHRRPT
jgi:DNA mismatch endonuclease, patch repair protein